MSCCLLSCFLACVCHHCRGYLPNFGRASQDQVTCDMYEVMVPSFMVEPDLSLYDNTKPLDTAVELNGWKSKNFRACLLLFKVLLIKY